MLTESRAMPIPDQQLGPTLQEQVPRLLTHVAGFVAHRTIAVGLRRGLVAALATAETGLTPDELAERLHFDPFYVAVWCRAAAASGVCDRVDDASGAAIDAILDGRYRLAAHVGTLLLDADHPAYVGGVFTVLEQPEVFDRFEQSLASGQRLWWDGCSVDWITNAAKTGMPFYTRLAPGGLAKIPGLAERLDAGCRVVDTACGAGAGLAHLARVYPQCQFVGVDGDRRSLNAAGCRLEAAGLRDRCALVHSPLEEMTLDQRATCVVSNISMHECRDIDRVTANVVAGLEPGGWFVISDFPFPETLAELRTVPGRVLCGIQFFEAQIDDQLLPRAAYDNLLSRHGFIDIGHVELSPVHALTYGRRPG